MEEYSQKVRKEDGRIVYNDAYHINELLKEILAYYKNEGLDKFEEISMYIKKKMTKLSIQFKSPIIEARRLIDLTPYEESILVYIY